MREINGIKALQGLLKAEKNYYRSLDKLKDTGIFGQDVEVNLGFDLSEIICEMLEYKGAVEDWAYAKIYDYVEEKYTLEEITKILLEN